MIHIAICDDEKEFIAHLTELLERYSKENGEEIKISAYYDGLELTEKYDTTIDLIFLDIQMKLVDGLKTAARIRQMDEKAGLIFLTTLTQYGLEGYRYQADNYIIKPMKYVRLKAEMDRWLKKHRKDDSPYIVVTNDTGKYKVFLKSLRYAETFGRNLLFHVEEENIICYKSMKEMERVTGEALPISQPKRKEVMERLALDYQDDSSFAKAAACQDSSLSCIPFYCECHYLFQ